MREQSSSSAFRQSSAITKAENTFFSCHYSVAIQTTSIKVPASNIGSHFLVERTAPEHFAKPGVLTFALRPIIVFKKESTKFMQTVILSHPAKILVVRA
jgi:hypothetical protein